MEYVYNFTLDTFSQDLPNSTLEQICDKALSRARIKAPIKTGNLRRSIKYRITAEDIVLYIDESMYTVPYYIYVNEIPGQSGRRKVSNGYWTQVVSEFGMILYANLDKQFEIYQSKQITEQKKIQAEQVKEIKQETKAEESKIKEEKLQRDAERKKRIAENKRKTDLLRVLAFMAFIDRLAQKEIKNGSKK